jgi:hypothetical protein
MEPEFDQQLEEPFDDEHNEEHPADPPPSPPSSAEQVDFGSRFSVSTNKFIGTVAAGRGTKRSRNAVFDNEISITSDTLRANFNTGFDTTRPAEASQNSADQNLASEQLRRQRALNIGEVGCTGEEAAFGRLIEEVFKIGEASVVRAAKKPKRGGEFDDPIDDIELPRSQEDAALEDGDDLFHSRASSIARASDASSPAMEEARLAVTFKTW